MAYSSNYFDQTLTWLLKTYPGSTIEYDVANRYYHIHVQIDVATHCKVTLKSGHFENIITFKQTIAKVVEECRKEIEDEFRRYMEEKRKPKEV
jgi:hypothetical protein